MTELRNTEPIDTAACLAILAERGAAAGLTLTQEQL